MQAWRRAVAVMSIGGLAGCSGDDDGGASDDGPSTPVQAGCLALDLVVGVVAGRLHIDVPEGIDNACANAVEAYMARQAVLNVELGNGDLITLQLPPPPSEPVTTLSPSLQAAVDRILASNSGGG
jgi:hypothetical protein